MKITTDDPEGNAILPELVVINLKAASTSLVKFSTTQPYKASGIIVFVWLKNKMPWKVWHHGMREMAGRKRGQGRRGEGGKGDEEEEDEKEESWVPARPCHPPTATHQCNGRPIPHRPHPHHTPPLPFTLHLDDTLPHVFMSLVGQPHLNFRFCLALIHLLRNYNDSF